MDKEITNINSQTGGDIPDGLPIPSRYWAILAIGLGVTVSVLDGAIANVALPTIAGDLHTSPSASIWVVNAYQLAITISLLSLSSMGEIWGYRKVYTIGLLLFSCTSLACALSDSLFTLIIARTLQGFGAAAIASVNTALIRRRIRDTRLKVIQKQIGTRSKTDYALMYIEDLVQKDILNKIQKQMDKICVDGIFDNGMLQQYLEKDSKTPFPLYQLTQRPDKVASSIMEGRIAVVLDNSPMVLLLPVTFNVFFQASDDYYNRWEITTFVRILRYVAAIISIGLPGFYVAIAGFHPEVLPTPFLLALISAREGVPFPVIVEVLLMELSFELLREAGIRLPGQLGGTMGVVGGLIVGQAAVDAHLVSTIVVIVVALTAIATFSIPNELFTSAFRLMKFFLIILCAFWGLYGFFLGFLAIFIHLFYLENYGVPYAHPMVEERGRLSTAFQDFMVRYPLKRMKYRPEFTKEGARVRQKEDEDEK